MTAERTIGVAADLGGSMKPCLPALLLVLSMPIATAAPVAPVVTGDLGAKLDRFLTDSHFAGAALVAKDGHILLMKGYGLANAAAGVPFSADSLISIGSITKQFTAAAILKLEAEGKLRVEDPIGKFFPSAPDDKKGITLHQLLTHTAGLESDFAGDYEPVGRDAYVKRILGSKLRSKPGSEYFYANSGYSLLAAIVEIASGEAYETYVHGHLFAPAGMTETGYRLPRWDARRVPVGLLNGKPWGTMLDKPWDKDGPYWALRGNGGIESTLADLFAWSRALDGDAVLPAAERKKLFTPYVPEGPGAESSYGYGWSIQTTPWNTKLVAHDGGNGVFSADFRRYVDDGIVVITGASDSRVKAWKFSEPLARIAHGEDVAPAPPRVEKLKPLGDTPREGVVREFVSAFNSHDIEKMHAFRTAHMPSRPGGPTEAQRDEVTKRMWSDMGTLEIMGVLGEEPDTLTVRMKPSGAPPVSCGFIFDRDGKLAGLRIEAD
jgi:CubicO group peptidase (beta-lactamase class C family)